jgi:hypothetical protein
MEPINPILIPIIAMLIPMIVVPVALGLKYARHVRELEHAERIRALELGRTLPQDEPWWSPPRLCAAIGAGVPVGVFFCAWMASTLDHHREEVWVAAALVGMTSVICGTALTAKHFAYRAQTEGRYVAKPTIDADAFDVVSRRG